MGNIKWWNLPAFCLGAVPSSQSRHKHCLCSFSGRRDQAGSFLLRLEREMSFPTPQLEHLSSASVLRKRTWFSVGFLKLCCGPCPERELQHGRRLLPSKMLGVWGALFFRTSPEHCHPLYGCSLEAAGVP